MDWDRNVGDAASILLTLSFFGFLFWAYRQRQRRVDGCVPDGPASAPYKVYTRAYDLTLLASEVPGALREQSPDRLRGWMMSNSALWHAQIAEARRALREIDSDGSIANSVAESLASAADWAIVVLVDQSGSMKGEQLTRTAAAARWLAQTLHQLGVANAVLGFSTVGWQGGKPRQDWLWNGSPKRPGRLCALLHVVYQDFETPMTEAAWEVMVHPDMLRENVDGEALEWAVSLLESRREPHRLLIVISDGAPVDDATLMHNGPSYLERHLMNVISKVEARTDMILAALGVSFAVDRYYRWSQSAAPADLPQAMATLISTIAASRRSIA